MPRPEITSDDDFTDEDRLHINITSDVLYRHKTLQLRYPTYDMREDEEKIYQRRHPDIMVLSGDNEHPYLYGRVLDLFHISVKNNSPNTLISPDSDPVILQLVWVRWFQLSTPPGPQGFYSLRYPSVTFHPCEDPDAFGFVHPDEIVRLVHLIPSFKHGHTTEYLDAPSRGRPAGETEDWKSFTVNM